LCISAQCLFQHRLKSNELGLKLLALVLRGNVAGGFEPLLDRVSKQTSSSAYLSVRGLVSHLDAPHLANHVHGDHL
jgi:hypothetical protein